MRALLLLAALALPTLAQTPDYPALRAAREARMKAPYGWLSLVALGSVRPGVATTVGSAAGSSVLIPQAPPHLLRLSYDGSTVRVVAADPSLQYAGHPLTAGTTLQPEEDDDHALTSGTLRLWLIDRGGKLYLRAKSPKAATRTHAHPFTWYAPDPRYRVTAHWVPFSSPHTMQVLNELNQVSTEPVPGYAEFTIDGHPARLTPMLEGGNLFFVFRDATAPKLTYGAGRFLTVPGPATGLTTPGTFTLDFNQAVNPPCAYSAFATCPVASPENRLRVAIPAGEKRYE